MRHDLEGVYNGAADGVLRAQRGRRPAGQAAGAGPAARGDRSLAAGALRRAGVRISPETLGLLRYGRGLDNRKLKATGYRYRYTSREAVVKLREYQRLAAIVGDAQEAYRYERDLEEFLRRSPSVRADRRRPEPAPTNWPPASAAAPAPPSGAAAATTTSTPTSSSLCCPRWSPRRWPSSRPTRRAHAARPEVMKAIASLQGWEART